MRLVVVKGCHECPFLKALPFGQCQCPFVQLPDGFFPDPLEIKVPDGCPLRGGTVTVALEDET